MAVLEAEIAPKLLTYEDYMAEGEDNCCYDIIDGERIFLQDRSILRQEIVFNLFDKLQAYQRPTWRGKVRIAPCDVLITKKPLRTRQPDVLFISRERYVGRAPQSVEPLSPAPELAIELLSPINPRSLRKDKIKDYCAVNVKECWLVSPQGETVEVLRLTPEGPVRAALYGTGQTLQSITFPELTLALDDIFRIEEQCILNLIV